MGTYRELLKFCGNIHGFYFYPDRLRLVLSRAGSNDRIFVPMTFNGISHLHNKIKAAI